MQLFTPKILCNMQIAWIRLVEIVISSWKSFYKGNSVIVCVEFCIQSVHTSIVIVIFFVIGTRVVCILTNCSWTCHKILINDLFDCWSLESEMCNERSEKKSHPSETDEYSIFQTSRSTHVDTLLKCDANRNDYAIRVDEILSSDVFLQLVKYRNEWIYLSNVTFQSMWFRLVEKVKILKLQFITNRPLKSIF